MSNVIAGVVRGQYPYLEEHIAQKKAIYERYKEGLTMSRPIATPADMMHPAPTLAPELIAALAHITVPAPSVAFCDTIADGCTSVGII